MHICQICQTEFFTKKQKGIHERFCKSAAEKYSHIDVEELKYLYFQQEYSIADLSSYYNVGKGLLNYMRRLGITNLRSIKESKTCKVKDKSKNTNLEKYGSPHNFSRTHPSRIKWEKEMLEKEGISNVFLRASVKEKIKKTLLERYGVDHPMRCKEIADRVVDSRGSNVQVSYRISSLHKKVCNILDEMKIEYSIEFLIKGEYKRCFYDIKIGNKIIEVNGDYWHANPILYKSTDLLSFHGNIFTAEEIWELDKLKKDLAISNGFDLMYIWETELQNSNDFIKEKILKFIYENRTN